MERERLLAILREWNYWERDVSGDAGVPRDITKKIIPFLSEREAIALSGPRRAGKSTVMLQLAQNATQATGPKAALYVNFEDPGLLPDLSLPLLDDIYDTYRERVHPKGRAFVFLDEVQNITGWEKWLRTQYDRREDAKFIVSGSSSALLSSELSSLLTGRSVNFEVTPLSFLEYLRFSGAQPPRSGTGRETAQAKYLLAEYLSWGGFPEITLKTSAETKRKTLEAYFYATIAKDVAQRYGIRDVRALSQVAVFALSNIGKELSYNSIRNTLGISLDSARDYLFYLENAFLLHSLPYFSTSQKETLYRNKKIYASDTGLRNAVSKSITPDSGRLAENAAYLKLRETCGNDICYWRGKKEVDFIARKGGKTFAINVSYTDAPASRETEGIFEFLDEHKKMQAKRRKIKTAIITSGGETPVDGIRTIPLWKFLTSPDPLAEI
ncbi:MAG: ATP-binding protein [Candidatus Micrarchaeia archaeon]